VRSVPAGRRLEPKGKAHLLEHLQHLAGVRASVNLMINGGEHSVALDIVRRPKATPIHELERYMRCKDCSEMRGYLYKRSFH